MKSESRFAAYLRLPRAEKSVLHLSLLLLMLTRIALATLSLPRTRTVLAGVMRPFRSARFLTGLPPARIGWAVQAASRFVPLARTCLPRALAGEALLEAAGHDPELHLGLAKRSERRLDAHAWVVCGQAVVVGDGGLDEYTPIPLPRA